MIVPAPLCCERLSDAKMQGSVRVKMLFKNQYIVKMHYLMFDGLYNVFDLDGAVLAIDEASPRFFSPPARAIFPGFLPGPH